MAGEFPFGWVFDPEDVAGGFDANAARLRRGARRVGPVMRPDAVSDMPRSYWQMAVDNMSLDAARERGEAEPVTPADIDRITLPYRSKAIYDANPQIAADPNTAAAFRVARAARPGVRPEGATTALMHGLGSIPMSMVGAAAGLVDASNAAVAEMTGQAGTISTDYDPQSRAAALGAETALNVMGLPGVLASSPASLASGMVSRARDPKLWHGISEVKLPKPVSEMTATHVPTQKIVERQIRPEDMQGGLLLPALGDRSVAGTDLTGFNGFRFDPVPMQGGHGFMPAHADKGVAWASGEGVVSRLASAARKLEEQSGKPVYFPYTAMGERSIDFSHHVAMPLARSVAQTPLTKTAERAFDAAMRRPNADWPAVKDWPGVSSPNLESFLLSQKGDVRNKFAKMMDTRQFQDAGFPSVAEARHAVIDPRLIDAPTGAAGLSVARLDPGRGAVKDVSGHITYDTDLAGKYIGGLGRSIPKEVFYPDMISAYRRMGYEPYRYDYLMSRGVSGAPIAQPANQKWVDRVSSWMEKNPKGNLLFSGGSDRKVGAAALAANNADIPMSMAPGVKTPGLPMDEASRMARAAEQRYYDPDLYHATTREFDQFDPKMAGTGTGTSIAGPEQPAVFLTTKPQVADTYLPQLWHRDPKNPSEAVKSYGTGSNIMPLRLRADDMQVWDMGGGGYTPSFMNQAIKDARKAKAPGVIFNNIRDPGYFGMGRPPESTVVAVLDPTRIRSKFAAFDPKNKDKSFLLGANAADRKTGAAVVAANQQPFSMAPSVRNVDELGFYSHGAEAARMLPQESGTPQQFRAMLEKAGVKKEEFETADFASLASKPKVTRDEVADLFEQNRVQLKEVRRSGLAHDDDWFDSRLAELQDDLAARNGGDPVDWYDTALTQVRAEEARRKHNNPPDSLPVKYSDYQLPGGKNYQEAVLTVPRVERDAMRPDAQAIAKYGPEWDRLKAEIEPFNRQFEGGGTEALAEINKRHAELDALHSKMMDETMARIPAHRRADSEIARIQDQMRAAERDMPRTTQAEKDAFNARMADLDEKLTDADRYSQPYRSKHWDEENPVVHIRHSDRMIGGKRTLFGEEFQSDAHQAGRRRGYVSERQDVKPLIVADDQARMARTEAVQNKWLELTDGKARSLREAGDYGYGPEAFRRFNQWRDGPEYKALDAAAEAARNRLRLAENKNAGLVPDLPFKATAAWTELAMKRFLKYAVDNGYEKIAWAPGRVHADRYDLSKHVKELEYIKQPDGKYKLGIASPDGGNIRLPKDAFTAEELPEVVGKEVADKIVAGAGTRYRGHEGFTLSGLDLKVGGRAMEKYYDEMVPAVLNKLTKKHGATVKRENMAASDMPDSEYLKYPAGHPYREKNFPEVHTLEITPSLRDELKRGVRLFSGATDRKAAAATIAANNEIPMSMAPQVQPSGIRGGDQ